MDFNGFDWVLFNCTGYYCVFFTEFYLVLMLITGFYWVSVGFVGRFTDLKKKDLTEFSGFL